MLKPAEGTDYRRNLSPLRPLASACQPGGAAAGLTCWYVPLTYTFRLIV